jgi:glucose/arabinose dehydrogenase
MKKVYGTLCLFCMIMISLGTLPGCKSSKGKARILVFAKTAGFHHESIPYGIAAIQKLGTENKFEVDTTTDARYFTDDSLKKYSAVVFLNTTDTADVLLDNYQKADFERYIQSGGGFVGVHAAADAEYHWGWYNRLVGASFKSHPAQQEAVLNVVDKSHGATKHLPAQWKRRDEWYNFKNLNKDVHVLIKIDEKSYQGGENGDDHPMAWYHEYKGGRAFYTELGHTNESYSEPDYLKHLLGGILYAIGDNKKLDYDKATTFRVPEKERFTKTQLVTGTFTEPTEMAVLPNLDIMVVQRRGEIFYFTNATKEVKQIGALNVYWKTSTPGVNAEEGLMGVQKDPDFEKNKFVYMYYAPVDTSVNRLSRFTMINDSIDLASEKVILQLYSQREICCHTGGSIAFGKDRMLFVSTGDNSTPFDEPKQKFVNHGYAPLNDEPGHEQYDARRTAGNTNDLRGKILRIIVNEDGTYSIPEGNLFKGSDKARPEIYVMGNRNPYRISVDQKNGYLYWGEVGPDAANDSLETRGPRGYDEVNQARKAGYFGWPLFIGNNYAYKEYNYTNGSFKSTFDAAKPVNTSLNNTGLQELPVPQPAFIYYPYSYTKDFPQVASGGRNAMAGPVYYTDMYLKQTRYDDYYNKKLFIYDWIRGWVKVVTMNEKGDFERMEPFADNMKFNSLIDLEVGADGKMYGLEYGSGWFSKNPDAGLFRIDFNSGNIPPTITAVNVDKSSGGLPLKISASVTATDIEKSKLNYKWDFGNGTTQKNH